MRRERVGLAIFVRKWNGSAWEIRRCMLLGSGNRLATLAATGCLDVKRLRGAGRPSVVQNEMYVCVPYALVRYYFHAESSVCERFHAPWRG